MKQLVDIKDEYEIATVNAYIDNDTIIPGLSGRMVNVEDSYKNMRVYNTFREDLLIFNSVLPSSSVMDNNDKYIIKGNKEKKEVFLIFIVNMYNIKSITNISNITLFIDHDLITIDTINKYKNNEIYTYGNNGVYNKSTLINDNTLINSVSNNKSIFCLVKEKDDDVINVCKNNNMFTVLPSLIGNYSDIKNNLSNGSIILLDSVNNLDNIVRYIKSKGYMISKLSDIIKE